MTIIASLPYTLTNGTTADASQVMADFNQIYNNVNTNAAANGANADITSMTALTSVTSAVNFSGTATATTQANSDSSTKLATTAFVQAVQQIQYPVGSLYFSTLSANPASILGFGTWTAYAAGQAVVGAGTYTDADGTAKTFVAGTTYGEFNHTLTVSEMPSHTHTDSGHSHTVADTNGGSGSTQLQYARGGFQENVPTSTSFANLANTGGGGAHNNIQPSIGVYIWTRTA